MKGLALKAINRYAKEYEEKKEYKALNGAFARTELKDIAFIPASAARLRGDFSVEITTRGITAQQKSGRCWAYACMNMMREKVMDYCGLDSFELSGNYIAFYDKLEKANNVLEMVIENSELSLDDRMMEYIINGIWDGGYWTMDVDLVQKYGICPKDVFPDNYQSSHTDAFMAKLNTLLRKDACVLREQMAMGNDVEGLKDEMMAEIYKMECIAFGQPVTTFNFEYRDRNGKYHRDEDITPLEFYERYVDIDLEDYVMVCCEPTRHKKINEHYRFHYIGCMHGSDVDFINISSSELEDLCIRQLEDGDPVWFSCDANAYGDRQEGIWDPASFDYENLFGGIDFDMERQDRLEYKNSGGNHAMILTGVNLNEKGMPDRWKIENSWGKEVGRDGYFVASEEYFQEYVYEAIILKKHLTERQLEILQREPVELKPWQG